MPLAQGCESQVPGKSTWSSSKFQITTLPAATAAGIHRPGTGSRSKLKENSSPNARDRGWNHSHSGWEYRLKGGSGSAWIQVMGTQLFICFPKHPGTRVGTCMNTCASMHSSQHCPDDGAHRRAPPQWTPQPPCRRASLSSDTDARATHPHSHPPAWSHVPT